MLMKKSNKILVGCLALLLVMAVGYALFSETITINGTATAKGEFDMTVTCIKGLVPDFVTDEFIYDNKIAEGGYKNDTCTVSGDTMTFNVDFEYPGARRYFTAKITNTGTIDAIFGNGSTEYKTCLDGGRVDEKGELSLDLEADGIITENECSNKEYGFGLDPIKIVAIVGFEKADGTKVQVYSSDVDDSYFRYYIGEEEYTYRLKPGESTYVVIKTGFDSRIDVPVFMKQNVTLKLEFTQPTVK